MTSARLSSLRIIFALVLLVLLNAGLTANDAPTVVTSATAVVVTTGANANKTATASALGADDAGESALKYNWTATWNGSGTSPATFSPNNTNAAKATTVTFTATGSYVLTVLIYDTASLSATSAVSVTVNQVLKTVTVAPASVNVELSATQAFTVTGTKDQFTQAINESVSPTWSSPGYLGSITSTGVYTAGVFTGTDSVRAAVTRNGVTATGTSAVTLFSLPPTVVTSATGAMNTAMTLATLSALGDDDGGAGALKYTWTSSGPATVTYSANEASWAATTTATISLAGDYTFLVTITDHNGGTATSATPVIHVLQKPKTVTVSPTTPSIDMSATAAFTVTALKDQFAQDISPIPTPTWSMRYGSIWNSSVTSTGCYTAGTAVGTDYVMASVTTSSGTASGLATVSVYNLPPQITGWDADVWNTAFTQVTLLVHAIDDDMAHLTFHWSATGAQPATVTFSVNDVHWTSATTLTFVASMFYDIVAQITDSYGLSVSGSHGLLVPQIPTTMVISPTNPNVELGSSQILTVSSFLDQFGDPYVGPAPTSTSWGFIGTPISGSTITGLSGTTGQYIAGLATGTDTVRATSSFSGSSLSSTSVAVTGTYSAAGTWTISLFSLPPTVATATPASAVLNSGGTTATLTVLGVDDGTEANLKYTWSATPATVTYNDNAKHWTQVATATLPAAGTYDFLATITDRNNQSATSPTTLVVPQIPKIVTLSATAATMNFSATAAFAVISIADQFGNPIADTTTTWTSSNTSVGTVSSSGVFTPGSNAGVCNITASVTTAAGTASKYATVTVVNATPTVAAQISGPSEVTGTGCDLSTLGADDQPESLLAYTWTATGPASVIFSGNNTNAGKNTHATFLTAGTYVISASIRDAQSAKISTDQVTIIVDATPSTLAVTPSPGVVNPSATLVFTSKVSDQFGTLLATQPTAAWSVSGGGSISATTATTATFSAGTSTGSWTISATAPASAVTGAASVRVNAAPTVATEAAADANPLTTTATTVRVLGADDGGEAGLTYTWSVTGTPPSTPTFSPNGTNAAKVATMTVGAVGTYHVLVTINDTKRSATSAFDLSVVSSPATVIVTPATYQVIAGTTKTFSAAAKNQFGSTVSATMAWSVDGPGSIDAGGVFTPGSVSGDTLIIASAGTARGTAVASTAAGPVFTSPASAHVDDTNHTTVLLAAEAADVGGASLTYSWSTASAGVTFDTRNGTASGAAVTASLSATGSYTFMVTATDSLALSATSTATVSVPAWPKIVVSPSTNLDLYATSRAQFAAHEQDQFDHAYAVQPTFTWSKTLGTINGSGLYQADDAGAETVTATDAALSVSGHVEFTVVALPRITNIAVGKPTTATGAIGMPATVVDGTSTGASLTADLIQVDLNHNTGLFAIRLFPISGHTTGNHVLVSSTPFTADDFATSLAQSGVIDVPVIAETDGILTAYLHPGQCGRYVRIQSPGSTAGLYEIEAWALGDWPAVTTPVTVDDSGQPTAAAASVGVEDPAGLEGLTYAWSIAPSSGATVSAEAQNVTLMFPSAGTYHIRVDITNGSGLTVSSLATFTKEAIPTTVTIDPATIVIPVGSGMDYVALIHDQYGNTISGADPAEWGFAGDGGTIDAESGHFTSTSIGTGTISATCGAAVGHASMRVDAPPTVATGAAVALDPGGTFALITVVGADNGGENHLTYSWTAPAGVIISPNDSNAAKSAVAQFSQAGSFPLTVLIKDDLGLSITTSATAVVPVVPTVTIDPSSAHLALNDALPFNATAVDQFGTTLAPPDVTVSGDITLSSTSAIIYAPSTPGSGAINATSGSVTAIANIDVVNTPPTIATSATAATSTIDTALLSVLGADDGTESNLTYTWSASPAAGVSFSPNGSNAAKSATATFTAPGTFLLTAAIEDAFGATITNSRSFTESGVGIAIPAQATLATDVSAQLSVLGADLSGEGDLTYTWSCDVEGVVFSTNGSNDAKTVTATFPALGTVYTLTVTIADVNTLATATSATSFTTPLGPKGFSALSHSPLVQPHAFAPQAYANDATYAATYDAAFEPSRVWASLPPGPDIPVIHAISAAYQVATPGHNTELIVQVPPHVPVSFLSLSESVFYSSGINAITVDSGDSGIVHVFLSVHPGPSPVLVASPCTSGRIRFEVTTP